LPLQDWLVPVLYQQVPYTPFVPRFGLSKGDELTMEEGSWEDGLVNYPDDLTGRFVGRDYDLLRLERGLRRSGVVLLQAIGGMGKTSLACELGRWWLQTKGCERVFFSSFAQGRRWCRWWGWWVDRFLVIGFCLGRSSSSTRRWCGI
jgi:hypothetical protein